MDCPTGPTFSSDYIFGINSEIAKHSQISKLFNTKFERKGGMSVFDFVNTESTIYVDLKTRRIRHDMYPTSIIGANKVEFADMDNSKSYHFVYQYEDGLYGIQYDKELFKTFEIRDFQRGSRSDYDRNSQLCYFIPVNHLRKLA